ncbi:MAG TPA: ABC transporter ATP-binding protein [Actinomycetota bacterium]|nr:ABC transporter ATP-binding protein [Actinomycetota bacterium]
MNGDRFDLVVRGLTVRYGPILAVRDVSFEVRAGEVVALLGANGAGKSTTLGAVMGLVRPVGGAIRCGPHDLRTMATEDIVRLGVGLVPERRRLFTRLTVAENLRLGARAGRDGSDLAAQLDTVFELFPVLQRRYRSPAGTLSGGEQQMLAIARALMGRPRILLLDEPSLGLAPRVVEELFGLLATLRSQGVTLLLVEQNVGAALELADRGYVLRSGEIVLSGSAGELLGSPEVVGAYLGGGGGPGPLEGMAGSTG